jgi:hypothetical protein
LQLLKLDGRDKERLRTVEMKKINIPEGDVVSSGISETLGNISMAFMPEITICRSTILFPYPSLTGLFVK